MNSSSGLSVAIIGGGFSGIATLIQLVKKSKVKTDITLFHKSTPLSRGIAFSTYTDEHLLNVAAKNMSMFPDQPDHFVTWLSKQETYSGINKEEISNRYVPRNEYGKYLEENYNYIITHLAPSISIKIKLCEVISTEIHGGQWQINSSDGTKVSVDKIILASGNHLPRPTLPTSHEFNKSKFYFPNPWLEESVSNTSEEKPVLIIGTGLTMIDVVQGLLEKNFKSKIIAVSTKGFHILPHRPHEPYKDIQSEIQAPYDLGKLFQIFRKHVRKVKSENKSGETVVDALRPKTQEIWQALSLEDKKKFMTHVRHLWGVARHRLPASVYDLIQSLISKNRLEIFAGKIENAEMKTDYATVHIHERKENKMISFDVQRVINCTGPESDPSRFESSLFNQLLKDGHICIDDMRLGLKSTPDGRIINSNGSVSNNIFAIGSLLRGTLWETTAVPELRVQAEKIAGMILGE